MRTAFPLALVLLAAGASPAAAEASAASNTDATICATYDGWVAFNSQWMKDTTGALTAGTLPAEVYEYLLKRVDVLTKNLPVKPTPGDLVQFCEDLNVLYPR